jgi:hypothetical protein
LTTFSYFLSVRFSSLSQPHQTFFALHNESMPAGLPDGIFSNPKNNLGKSRILWSFGLFHCHLEYFMTIWYIVWPFGIFCGHFGIFWYVVPRIIWQPWMPAASLLVYPAKSGSIQVETSGRRKSGD